MSRSYISAVAGQLCFLQRFNGIHYIASNYIVTVRRGRVVNTPASYSKGPGFISLPGDLRYS
jgi:hypothetical protein